MNIGDRVIYKGNFSAYYGKRFYIRSKRDMPIFSERLRLSSTLKGREIGDISVLSGYVIPDPLHFLSEAELNTLETLNGKAI